MEANYLGDHELVMKNKVEDLLYLLVKNEREN